MCRRVVGNSTNKRCVIREAPLADVLRLRHTVMWPDRPLNFVRVAGDGDAGTVHLGLYVLKAAASTPGENSDTQSSPSASAEEYGRLVSVVSLFFGRGSVAGQEGDTASARRRVQFRKFATVASEQGQGYGTALLQYAMAEAARRGASSVWCNARAEKAAFYQHPRFGLWPAGEPFERDGKRYVALERFFPSHSVGKSSCKRSKL